MSEKKTNQVAVIIPLHKIDFTPSEYFSFQNTIKVLAKYHIYIIGPQRLNEYFQSEPCFSNLKLKVFKNKYFENTSGYNELMFSRLFYNSFSIYKYILIIQTDALVFSDKLEYWCNQNYSYVGAPWFEGMENPTKPLTFFGVGNGGFSLRKVEDFLNVLYFPRYIKNKLLDDSITFSGIAFVIQKMIHKVFFSYNFPPLFPRLQEDAFWGILVPDNCSFFKVPDAAEASKFAFEAEPKYLYKLNDQVLPFGSHAWERYDSEFWKNTLKEHGITLP